MYQANVKHVIRGTVTVQRFETWDAAANSLTGLLRANGYPYEREDIRAQLAGGNRVQYGNHLHWVSEVA